MINSSVLNTNIEWKSLQKDGYKLYQSGSHITGNFIRILVPDSPKIDAQHKRKLITYLHGFALCLPQFYENHLEFLVKEGYYVFFPDFQKSDYPDDLGKSIPSQNKRHLYFWYQMAIDTITNSKSPTTDQIPKQIKKANEFYRIREAPNEPEPLKCLMISLAIAVIILAIRLVYLFSPKYSKNLVKLISTVGLSLLYNPSVWIKNSIDLTSNAWKKLCQDEPELNDVDFDFYVFGHSLGGLIALSWPAYVADVKFQPKQILTAAPAPSTEMGIPRIAIFILKLFRSPFTLEPITIQDIGSSINIPVAILHGADDKIVKPKLWVQRALFTKKSNFDYIASLNKKIYFSLSALQNSPPLIAFHNQAVTNTNYFDDVLFENFGGAKDKPNAYNYQYIWPSLNLIIDNQADVNDLLNKLPLRTIQVTDTLPPQQSFTTWIIFVLGLILLVLTYWYWHMGAL